MSDLDLGGASNKPVLQDESPSQHRSTELEISGPHGNNVETAVRAQDHAESKTYLTYGGSLPVKLGQDMSQYLPVEIWHRVFVFLPPRDLGILLKVNRRFHYSLDPVSQAKHFPSESSLPSCLPFLPADAIWRASRRQFWPRMPAPLKDKSEVEMWRITCSTACQFCHFQPQSHLQPIPSMMRHGPGRDGISTVFPFFVLCCANCLMERTVKELDVYLSSSIPAALLPGLTRVFLTSNLCVIPPNTLQSQGISAYGQPTKLYWRDHLDAIRTEFNDVLKLGSAAAEEWVKGLETRGKDADADVSRWEKWQSHGGIQQMLQLNHSGSFPFGDAVNIMPRLSLEDANSKHLTTVYPDEARPNVTVQPKDSLTSQHDGISDQASPSDLLNLPATAIDTIAPPSNVHPQHSVLSTKPQQRSEKPVGEKPVDRRAEIERRASLLHPPIHPFVLAHLTAFQAAVEVETPLTDTEWQQLIPLLLAQYQNTQHGQLQNVNSTSLPRMKQQETKPNHKLESQARGDQNQEWSNAQNQLRARIAELADTYIQNKWGDNHDISHDDAPQFAADVLLSVRRQFYEEIERDDATGATRAAGRISLSHPSQGPWKKKLTLENMRWLYDQKINPKKTLTQRTLFLCNGCEADKRNLWALEPLIQHYASKHTETLSIGNTVVNWRAEWPEIPIFDPEPRLWRHSRASDEAVSTQTARPSDPTGRVSERSLPAVESQQQANEPKSSPAVLSQNRDQRNAGNASAPQNSIVSTPTQLLGRGNHTSLNENLGTYGPELGTWQNSDATNQATSSLKDRYHLGLDLMGRVTKDTWAKVGGFPSKKLSNTMKVFVVIYHISKRFNESFSEGPPLTMFMDGLANNRNMKCISFGGHGLSCKICSATDKLGKSKTLSLPELSQHFQQMHDSTSRSWVTDMIQLPGKSLMKRLPKTLGHHQAAFTLVSEAISWALEDRPLWKGVQQAGADLPSTGQQKRSIQNSSSDHEPSRKIEAANDRPTKRPKREVLESPAARPAEHAIDCTGSRTEPGGRVNSSVHDKRNTPTLMPASAVYGAYLRTEESKSIQREHQLTTTEKPPFLYIQHARQSRSPPRGNRKDTSRPVPFNSGPMEVHYLHGRSNLHEERHSALESQSLRATNDYSTRLLGQQRYSQPQPSALLSRGTSQKIPMVRREVLYAHDAPQYSGGDWYEAGDFREKALVKRRRSGSPYERELYQDEHCRRAVSQYPVYNHHPERNTGVYHSQYRPSCIDQPSKRVAPANEYELFEVRDPRGNYFVRRPIVGGVEYVYQTDALATSSRYYTQSLGVSYAAEPVRQTVMHSEYEHARTLENPSGGPSSVWRRRDEYDTRQSGDERG